MYPVCSRHLDEHAATVCDLMCKPLHEQAPLCIGVVIEVGTTLCFARPNGLIFAMECVGWVVVKNSLSGMQMFADAFSEPADSIFNIPSQHLLEIGLPYTLDA